MEIYCYILVLFQLLSMMDDGHAAIGGGPPINGVDNTEWQRIVSKHLCPLIRCEEWCDCSEVEPNFIWGNSTVSVSSECKNSSNSTEGNLKIYTDCVPVADNAYFKWFPEGYGGRKTTVSGCSPSEMSRRVHLMRVRSHDDGLYWKVHLSNTHDINVTQLCDSVPPRDSCSLCNRHTDLVTSVSSPRPPGQGTRTTSSPGLPIPSSPVSEQPGSGNAGNSNRCAGNESLSGEKRTAFIKGFGVGVGVGVGVAVLFFILVYCLVIYIRRKMNRNRHRDQQPSRIPNYQVDSNQYSTIERPQHNGNARAIFTISPQTSVESGSPHTKKKAKRKTKKSLISTNEVSLEPITSGPYTEYYADRSISSYAGLQPVASDSALLSRGNRTSAAGSFNVFAEYQEPDQVMPTSINTSLFEDNRLSTPSSFNSFKLPGEYMDPQDINGPGPKKATVVDKDKEPEVNGDSGGLSPEHVTPKHFKQKGNESTPPSSMWHGKKKGKQKKTDTSASCKESSSSNKQSPSSPDGTKDGALFQELVATLSKKKKPVSKSESTPLEIEAENPYAEVNDASFSNDSPRVSRQRSHSQPMVSTLSGYRTYEEIKPRAYQANTRDDQNISVFPDANPYFELEDPNASRRHYFELENLNEETSNQQYFVLEKPSSLPLDTKKKKKREEQKTYYDQHEETATLYKNDKCAISGSGFRHNHFDLCVDNDPNKSHLNGVATKAPTYFQLEKAGERSSLGSMAQEYLSSSENEFSNDRNSRAEGTLTFYPGGRKRSSTYSLEEQAYDRLNRSARSSRASSRRSMINTGTPASSDGPYACISPSEEYNQITRTTTSKNKSIKKKMTEGVKK